MTREASTAKPENTANECHRNPRSPLHTDADAFHEQWQRLNEAEKKLHNLQAAHDRALQKSRECGRRWEALMSDGDGTVSPEAEELDSAITQANGQAARLAPLIEAQAVEVLRLRVPAREAAFRYKESHRLLAVRAAGAALEELLSTALPLLIAQHVRQVIGLYQLAGLPTGDAERKISDTVSELMEGDHADAARAAIEQNGDGSHALSCFPPCLPVEVEKSLRYAPSPTQQSIMQQNPDYELRLALGHEKMTGSGLN